MNLQGVRVYLHLYSIFAKFVVKQPIERLQSIFHRWMYCSSLDSRTVVIVGGSFAGSHLAQRLSHTLPSGHRVILVEKNSHMHYAFAFPRNAVFSGRETRALIPYNNLAAGAPEGIFEHVQDRALGVTDSHLILNGGTQLKYDYLILATGAAQPPPARLQASTQREAIAEFRGFQNRIRKAERVAVIGGGAAGIELVTEIRTKYPDKKLSLVHSGNQLLSRFGPKLHSLVINLLRGMHIEVILAERVVLPDRAGNVVEETKATLSTGETRTWDLMIPCTGLRPNTGILSSYLPQSIAPSGEIMVKPSLQVAHTPDSKHNIFALGDVARTGGPKQGRAGMMQAEVVLNNVLRLINNKQELEEYNPSPFEGALQLTIGEDQIMYMQINGYEFLKYIKGKSDVDVGAAQMWKKFHATYP